MRKKLDTANIVSELSGQSAFFPSYQKDKEQEVEHKKTEQVEVAPTERYHDTMTPRNHDTTISNNEDDIFEMARKAVKQVGKEAATHRFTLEEKNLLADIEYSYRRQGIRTSENEITRIAINYFAQEYRKNGENSLLAKILKLLNS